MTSPPSPTFSKVQLPKSRHPGEYHLFSSAHSQPSPSPSLSCIQALEVWWQIDTRPQSTLATTWYPFDPYSPQKGYQNITTHLQFPLAPEIALSPLSPTGLCLKRPPQTQPLANIPWTGGTAAFASDAASCVVRISHNKCHYIGIYAPLPDLFAPQSPSTQPQPTPPTTQPTLTFPSNALLDARWMHPIRLVCEQTMAAQFVSYLAFATAATHFTDTPFINFFNASTPSISSVPLEQQTFEAIRFLIGAGQRPTLRNICNIVNVSPHRVTEALRNLPLTRVKQEYFPC